MKHTVHLFLVFFFQITKDVKLWLNDKFESKTKKKMDRSVKNVNDSDDNMAIPSTKNALLVIRAHTNRNSKIKLHSQFNHSYFQNQAYRTGGMFNCQRT